MKARSAPPAPPRRTRRSAPSRHPTGPVTLEMVAQAAGVSPSTVSRILNGTASVSADKQTAVEAAIGKLGFKPNPVARGLAGGRTLSVGVVTQAIDSPFYGGALRGIEVTLDAAGYSPLFVSGHWDAAEEARCIDVLRSRRVDGIIVLDGRTSDQALRQHARSLPLIVTGRRVKAPGLCALDFDNHEGGRLATRHLLELGHRRIAFVAGDPKHPDGNERQRGYRTALDEAGVAFDPGLVVPGAFTEYSGLLAAERLLESRTPFTAIFAANDQMAFGAMVALNAFGRRVPDDVSIVGFDDQAFSAYTNPPLTTLRQPTATMGRAAVTAVLDLLAGKPLTLPSIQTELIVRQSTAPLASR
jgi:LacI family transcriptional regulator